MSTPPTQPHVRIMCPNLVCRKVLAVPESCRGKTVRCKTCSTNIRVPNRGTDAPPAPAQQGKTKAA
ncbi:MAG TPA: hypothetical protein VHN77_05405 [Phycisphaerales bacterium]|nr:hypothetical protein [Phycisphaerales bacterium]